jgi:hypothetical protein
MGEAMGQKERAGVKRKQKMGDGSGREVDVITDVFIPDGR